MLTHAERIARLRAAVARGHIVRQAFRGTVDGHACNCLLTTLVPELLTGADSFLGFDFCPSDVMPRWLAALTPWMCDAGTLAAWPAILRRYADLAERWIVLNPEAWHALEGPLTGIRRDAHALGPRAPDEFHRYQDDRIGEALDRIEAAVANANGAPPKPARRDAELHRLESAQPSAPAPRSARARHAKT